MSDHPPFTDPLPALEARIAALENAPGLSDLKASIAALDARMATLEKSTSVADLASTVGTLGSRVRGSEDAIRSVQAAAAAAVTPADLASVKQSVSDLQAQIETLHAGSAGLGGAMPDDGTEGAIAAPDGSLAQHIAVALDALEQRIGLSRSTAVQRIGLPIVAPPAPSVQSLQRRGG